MLSASENRSSGQSYHRAILPTHQRGEAHSSTESARPLLTPDEVMRLDPGQQLLFLAGTDPLLIERVNYLRDPQFRGLFARNPLHLET